MKLCLNITSAGANHDFVSALTLEHEGATIGRLGDNTLVLPDAKKYISGHHARIQYHAPDYYITDISTNGVLINQSSAPLGNGNSARLNDGDRIQIGDYTISVRMLESPPQVSAFDNKPHAAGSFDAKSFDFNEDPFAEIGVDLIKKTIDDNELIPADWKGQHDPFDLPISKDSEAPQQKTAQPEPKPFEQIPAFKEAFQPFSGQTSEQPPKEAAPAHSSAEATADIFNTDWFSDLGSKKSSDALATKPSPFADFPSPSTAEEIHEKTAPPQIPTPKTPRTPSVREPESSPVVDQTSAPRQPESLTAAHPRGLEEELIKSFLAGAGLENSLRAETLNSESFHIIGKILRESIQGTLDVLIGRAKIKNEMHLDVTTIRARQNNPIKFSVSAEEAMVKLLTAQDTAYLKPEAAIKEVFDDIRAHQFAVIAGMRTALLSVLKRFDPKKLEQRLQETSPIAASIPFHKQAKLWSLFEQLHTDLGHEAEDNFYHLFGQAFAESYEQQMQKLKRSTPTNPPD